MHKLKERQTADQYHINGELMLLLQLLIIIHKFDKIGFVAKLEKSEDQTTQKAHNCERLETTERERD